MIVKNSKYFRSRRLKFACILQYLTKKINVEKKLSETILLLQFHQEQ